ncbi:hypothetical protein NDU88_007302 [Pleurodeles waltl]|uniref:Integrase catalytic domain-containing protein n=1 Tax=Pleurodeles waltl TaxID=8319 RepID=A0AAV7SS33_PLEWA|nr:hypothetical protein NDU88_007302 [Pleurodeles waltl]
MIWSDNGSEFVGQVMKKVCEGLGINQKFHAANHSQSAGLVECYNGTLKLKLAKIQASSGLKWPDALPLALLSTRMTVHSRVKLSPYETVFGRPANIWGVPRPKKFSEIEHLVLLDYLYELTAKLRVLHQQVHDTLPPVSESPGHPIEPGSWVLIKNFQRTKNEQPRWTGPHLVLLSTRSAVRVEGKKHWIHGTHCKRVPLPLPYDRWVQEGVADSETETVPRFLPFSDARIKGILTEKESDDILQSAVSPSVRLDTTEPELLFQDHTIPGTNRYNL